MGKSVATPQALGEGCTDRQQKMVCRNGDMPVPRQSRAGLPGEHPFSLASAGDCTPQQARNCGREEVGTGRLPQIISAARVSIQPPNRTAHIPFPEGRTCPAIQDPGERGRRGSERQTDTQPFGAQPSPPSTGEHRGAKSQSGSQQCTQPGQGKKNVGKKETITLLFLPFQDYF